jgi:hypothetical protein
MDLGALVEPLASGRIAAAVDESSIAYYGKLRTLSHDLSGVLPLAGSGGPLIQAGLIFSNPDEDGGFYERFWQMAVSAARSGYLVDLPFDDMCIVSSLLGQGGPQWGRFLALGHEWNYITDSVKDPGVFGCVAHYGGHRAKALLLKQQTRLFPQGSHGSGWGTCASPTGGAAVEAGVSTDGPKLQRGLWTCPDGAPNDAGSVALPFALTWTVPDAARACVIAARTHVDTDATLHVYVDGRLVTRMRINRSEVTCTIPVDQAETVTLIGVGHSGEPLLYLRPPFPGSADGGAIA